MIELFTIFGKGGLVLWCFGAEGQQMFKEAVNELLSTVLLQQRALSSINHQGITLKYRLDNEFDLVLVVAYQSMVQMAYSDKLLTEVHLRFRDAYKNVLEDPATLLFNGPRQFKAFDKEFPLIHDAVRAELAKIEPPKPRTFQESHKSKKTVASMIEQPGAAAEKAKKAVSSPPPKAIETIVEKTKCEENERPADRLVLPPSSIAAAILKGGGRKKGGGPGGKFPAKPPKAAAPAAVVSQPEQGGAKSKAGKKARVWDLTGTNKDAATLDYSAESKADEIANAGGGGVEDEEGTKLYKQNLQFVGKMRGELPGLDEGREEEDEINGDLDRSDEDGEDEEGEFNDGAARKATGGGWYSTFKSLVGNKQLTRADLEPVLEKMKEILITKNVASEPASKICESVETKLEGRVIGTFSRVQTTVREAVREALIQLLTPKRRVDILRDIIEAKSQQRPYVIVFCGVNGVGKSTNLAKITFWLNENGHRVLIAAGDTFRAGAVEQLRTHTRHLNALHAEGAQLYEQGYGKDPANLAAAAIQIARERRIDVVLVDTAGRMQDNEPLMRSLSKLIRVNEPDLVLFVGEALVGNEAVDQLVKFNQALADNSAVDTKARLIDGIVLTKFDTIDDKVGAAISMTYITGQPIVFVGTGQTYSDLKSLNANAVVNSLMK